VAVPPDGTLALAGHDAVTPVGAETLRFTVPVNPWRLVRVTVPLAEEPAGKEMF